jgi:predicted protein tyrosine phosphatase
MHDIRHPGMVTTRHPTLCFCPLDAVAEAIALHAPSHLVSLLDQASMIETPGGLAPERHLKLPMNDISARRDDLIAPTRAHVEALIDFVRSWDQKAPLLLHCWLGISRSTAAAYITLCALNDGNEDEIARRVRGAAPHAAPNPLLVALADDVLDRYGRMSAAISGLGPGIGTRGALVALQLNG